MQNKTRRFCTVTLISCGLINLFAQTNLNVKENSGNNSSFAINNIRKLTFSNGNLNVISLNSSTNSFSLSSVKNLNFKSIYTTIQNEKSESTIQIFPNPATDFINIEGKLDWVNNVGIEIIDLSGNVLKTQVSTLPCRINISELKNGIYICRLQQSNETENYKIIKK